MNQPIIMHVNYCEQGQTIAEICHKAAQWGFDGVEFRRKRNGVEESQTDYLDALEKAVSESGLKKVIFGSPGPNLMQEDAGAREKEVADCIEFLGQAKKRFDAKWFNTFTGPLLNPDKSIPYSDYEKQGSGIATEEHYQWAAEGFKTVAKFAESEGLKLGFETHMGYLHDMPVPAKRLVDAIGSPSVGLTFDYCNMFLLPSCTDIDATLEVLDDSVFYLHLKNLYKLPPGGYVMTSLADGQINNREMISKLLAKGFNGPICVEAPRQGDREWFAREDLAYIQSLLADWEG
jgi:sugar phosphate isomerase/epimerase